MNDHFPLSKRARLSENEPIFNQDKALLSEILTGMNAQVFERNWIARRVDIIVCPMEQYPFALLGIRLMIRIMFETSLDNRLVANIIP
jgi:hypothetical protein